MSYKKYYSSNSDGATVGLAIVGVIALIAFLVIIAPLVTFWLAYFGGWIASLVIGGPLTQALNTLFHTDYFTKDMLPWMAGALGWIGGFFKSVKCATKKND